MKANEVRIAAAGEVPTLVGELTIPANPLGIVLFAQGSGSGRESPSDRFVAAVLHEARLATLLFGFLDAVEARTHQNIFDEELLATRLAHANHWIAAQPETAALPRGYFGADTGAAAALIAAAREPESVAAIVSRGGCPHLAWSWLHLVRAPTLLLIGAADEATLDCNREAHGQLKCDSELVVIPGATHLFSAPGALSAAAEQACRWFLRCLAPGASLSAADAVLRAAASATPASSPKSGQSGARAGHDHRHRGA